MKDRGNIRKFIGTSVIILFLFFLVTPVFAVPAEPSVHTLQGKDGSQFTAKLWGDEWSHGWETTDGYSIVLNEMTKDWTYAIPSADGNLVSSNNVVGTDSPPGMILEHLRPNGKAQGEILRLKASQASGLPDKIVPATGTANIPVILINFNDRTTTYSAADFNNLLFGTGTKSMKDYFQEVSYNNFSVSPGPSGIAGWYGAAKNHDYYGQSSQSSAFGWSGTLVREAVAAADPSYDFAPYDSDGDCYVDVVNIIHQGAGEEAGGDSTNIWSHSYDLNSAYWYGISDGREYTTNDKCPSGGFIKVNAYVIQPETLWGNQQTLGVFAHEYAHALGLPDLYDGTYASAGVGAWSLMGNGCWNQIVNGGDTPAHPDAWSKSKLSWVFPTQVRINNLTHIRETEHNRQAYQLLDNPGGVNDWNGYGKGTGEYFLVENRQRIGFDAALPGEGLLIWHINESMGNNQNYLHKLVSLEEADGQSHLDRNINSGDAFDPWYNSVGGFTSTSIPNSRLSDGSDSQAKVTNIGPSATTMTVYINVGASVTPLPGYTTPPTDPDNDGIYEDLNGNGRLDFADVVLYFNQMEWIAANEPVSAFDLNGNGRIDFADIVKLFGEI